jgi:hypothetical protein
MNRIWYLIVTLTILLLPLAEALARPTDAQP